MFFVELSKYRESRNIPIVDMFEDLGAEAFTLLLESLGVKKLKVIFDLIPKTRTDISDMVMQTGY